MALAIFDSIYKPKQPKRNVIQRQTRSDKLHDIKTYVTDEQDTFIRRKARLQCKSITKYCTDLVCKSFQYRTDEFNPNIRYDVEPYMVHIHLDRESYEELVEYSVIWRCSIRQAAYIVLQTLLEREMNGR